jgi:hypothetical protein
MRETSIRVVYFFQGEVRFMSKMRREYIKSVLVYTRLLKIERLAEYRPFATIAEVSSEVAATKSLIQVRLPAYRVRLTPACHCDSHGTVLLIDQALDLPCFLHGIACILMLESLSLGQQRKTENKITRAGF